jgi:hypothetical protein
LPQLDLSPQQQELLQVVFSDFLFMLLAAYTEAPASITAAVTLRMIFFIFFKY